MAFVVITLSVYYNLQFSLWIFSLKMNYIVRNSNTGKWNIKHSELSQPTVKNQSLPYSLLCYWPRSIKATPLLPSFLLRRLSSGQCLHSTRQQKKSKIVSFWHTENEQRKWKIRSKLEFDTRNWLKYQYFEKKKPKAKSNIENEDQ